MEANYIEYYSYDVLHTGPVTSNSIFVPLTLNNREVSMEPDTGSWVTIVTKKVWFKISSPHLKKVMTVLRSFTCHSIPPLGKAIVPKCRKAVESIGCRQRLLRSCSTLELGSEAP